MFVKGQSGNPGGRGRDGKRWKQAILMALKRRPEALDAIANKLLDLAEAGERFAIQELGDRLDGKAAMSVSVDTGEVEVVRDDHEVALERLKSIATKLGLELQRLPQ